MKLRVALFGFFLASVTGVFAIAEETTHVRAELVAEFSHAAPGETLRIGFHYSIPEHAHIYWRNAGTSGFPTGVEWSLPEGATAGPLQWPVPMMFHDPMIDDTTYGYENEVSLFAEITIPDNVEIGSDLTIAARSYWLVCLEDGECIPEDTEQSVTIGVAEKLEPSDASELLDASTEALPSATVPDYITAKVGGGRNPFIELTIEEYENDRAFAAILAEPAAPAVFFPYRGEPWRLDRAESNPKRLVFKPTGPVVGFGSGVVKTGIKLGPEPGSAIFMMNARVGIRPKD